MRANQGVLKLGHTALLEDAPSARTNDEQVGWDVCMNSMLGREAEIRMWLILTERGRCGEAGPRDVQPCARGGAKELVSMFTMEAIPSLADGAPVTINRERNNVMPRDSKAALQTPFALRIDKPPGHASPGVRPREISRE